MSVVAKCGQLILQLFLALADLNSLWHEQSGGVVVVVVCVFVFMGPRLIGFFIGWCVRMQITLYIINP